MPFLFDRMISLTDTFTRNALGWQSHVQTSGPETIADNRTTTPLFDVNEQLSHFSDWLPDWLLPYWQALEHYPAIGAVVITLLGYLLAKLAVYFTRSLTLQITQRTKSTLDDELVELLSRPAFVTIFFYFLGLALRSLDISSGLTSTVLKILASVVVVVWLNAALPSAKLMLDILSRLKERFSIIEERTIPLFNIVSSILLIGLGSYALLIIWGINPAAWLASAGVIGIAVGFAAKDTLANLFSGVFIVADAPYKIGDYINLDSGERGMVTHVGLRSTRLLTRDDVEITIPNAIIANTKIINESGGPSLRHRIRIKVGTAYGSDVDNVMAVLEAVASEHDQVCHDPIPRVRLRNFGDSSLDFELLCWIEHPSQRGLISHELNMAIYKRFQRDGIEIPYPKRDLYLKELPKGASLD